MRAPLSPHTIMVTISVRDRTFQNRVRCDRGMAA